MSKIDFIIDLLNDKRIETSQKERLFQLISKEMESFEVNDQILFHEIELIKQRIGIENTNKNGISIEHKNIPNKPHAHKSQVEVLQNNLPDYLDPKANSKYLFEFNQNPILNSISHLIDANHITRLLEIMNISEYDFKKHTDAIKKEFKKLSNKFYNKTSKGLYEKIYTYINGNGLWSNDKIEFSWSDPLLAEWAVNNLGKWPNPDESCGYEPYLFNKRIEFQYRDPIRSMNELVYHFKDQITIRGTNNLTLLSNRWLYNLLDKIELDTSNIDNRIDLYTDVEKLGQALHRIILLCIEVSPRDKPNIYLSLKLLEDKIVFGVLHKNSKYGKPVQQTILRYGTIYSGLIDKQINGLCDLDLTADFGNSEFARISLWPQKDEITYLPSFEGVLHELKFYR